MQEPPKPTVRLRNGEILTLGDEVTTAFHKTCEGKIFVVCEMNPYGHCESGMLIVAHLKDHPERRMEGFARDGYQFQEPAGIDANHFKRVEVEKV